MAYTDADELTSTDTTTAPGVDTAFDEVGTVGPGDFDEVEDPEDETRHSRDNALEPKMFEHLVESTYRMDDYYGLQARFVLFMAGRLGLRAGEIAHMDESWIDWRRSLICIPRQYDCTKGKDGGICGMCRQNARQKAGVRTENRYEEYHRKLDGAVELEPGRGGAQESIVDEEVFTGSMWTPKTENAVREIAFDSVVRAGICVDRFFERFDSWPISQVGVNRRVTSAAEECPQIDPDDIFPHALRATGATFWADRGLGPKDLKQLLGWSQLSTARNYISESTVRLSQAMRHANR